MNIRLATIEDEELIIDGVEQFYNNSPFLQVSEFDRQYLISEFERKIKEPVTDFIVFLTFNDKKTTGLLIASKGTLPFSATSIGLELVWYIYPEYQSSKAVLLLLEAYEYWCKNIAKVDIIQIGSLPDLGEKTIEKRFSKRGFIKTGNHWMKKLWE